VSKVIKKLYHKKGVPAPDGKGIHTYKFHDMATSIKKEHPDYPMSRCYAIAMGQLGSEKAVKKSHQRNSTKKKHSGSYYGSKFNKAKEK